MRSKGPVRLLAVALVFILLGAAQWVWSSGDSKQVGQAMAIGGVAVAIVAIVLMVRGRSTSRPTDTDR